MMNLELKRTGVGDESAGIRFVGRVTPERLANPQQQTLHDLPNIAKA